LYVYKDARPTPGIWDVPAFVHKSGGFGGTNDKFSNVCFSHLVEYQYYSRQGFVFNACHFHPLGPFWRQLFCEAVGFIGAENAEVGSFCDDGCWYRGVRSKPVPPGFPPADDNRWCRRIQTFGGNRNGGTPLDPGTGGVTVYT